MDLDLTTISNLVGVMGASFMSSTAMFSLFNWKMRNIREKARSDFEFELELHQKKLAEENQQKNGNDSGESEQVGLNVFKRHRRVAGFWYNIWLLSNIVPVAISVILAFLVSAPLVFPVLQDFASQELVTLIKVGIWGLMVSLLVQTLSIILMYYLQGEMRGLRAADPPDVYKR